MILNRLWRTWDFGSKVAGKTVCVYKFLTSVSLKSDTLEHPNMVWEVKTNQMPNAVQKLLLVVDKRTSGMNESLDLLKCNENLPSSPGYVSGDEHMELGK